MHTHSLVVDKLRCNIFCILKNTSHNSICQIYKTLYYIFVNWSNLWNTILYFCEPQEAVKFMHHGKRHRLSTADIDHALRAQNIEVFCVCSYTTIPFRIIPFRLSGYLTCCNFFQSKNFLIYENFINFDCLIFYKVKSNMNFKKKKIFNSGFLVQVKFLILL